MMSERRRWLLYELHWFADARAFYHLARRRYFHRHGTLVEIEWQL